MRQLLFTRIIAATHHAADKHGVDRADLYDAIDDPARVYEGPLAIALDEVGEQIDAIAQELIEGGD